MWSRISDDSRTGSFAWALALALSGLGLLLFNFGVFAAYEPVLQYVLGGVLGIGGIAFFGAYLSTRSNWWRLMPAWTLLALAVMVYLSTIETLDQRLTASVLFAGQALAFVHVYLLDRQERWWAIIPGGFMLVLGVVIALSRALTLETLGSVLFIGLGLVFLLLYALGARRRLWWALIPGVVLVVFGLFLLSAVEDGSQSLWLRWWPLLLIVVAIFAGWQAWRRPKPEKLGVESAPNLSHRGVAKTSSPPPGPGALGQYKGPAPGASVEVLSEPDGDDG